MKQNVLTTILFLALGTACTKKPTGIFLSVDARSSAFKIEELEDRTVMRKVVWKDKSLNDSDIVGVIAKGDDGWVLQSSNQTYPMITSEKGKMEIVGFGTFLKYDSSTKVEAKLKVEANHNIEESLQEKGVDMIIGFAPTEVQGKLRAFDKYSSARTELAKHFPISIPNEFEIVKSKGESPFANYTASAVISTKPGEFRMETNGKCLKEVRDWFSSRCVEVEKIQIAFKIPEHNAKHTLQSSGLKSMAMRIDLKQDVSRSVEILEAH